jgi:hypothetical protein
MSRAWIQFVVALGLGAVSSLRWQQPNGDGEFAAIALVVAGAGATVIAPRFWWMGFAALWTGQGLTHMMGSNDVPLAIDALRTSITATAAPFLIGATLGGAMWSGLASRRRAPREGRPCAVLEANDASRDSC